MAVWDSIIQKLHLKLITWKKKHICQRLTMRNSVLASVSIYYIFMYHMPTFVAKEIEKIIRNFFWGSSTTAKKRSWVSWSKEALPKAQGGIVIKNLRLVNKSLHCKWT